MTAAKNRSHSFDSQMKMAERELGAFMSAVMSLYGCEQARISAQDWLDEFESMHVAAELTSREWRQITIAAAARLANRLSALTKQPEKLARSRWLQIAERGDSDECRRSGIALKQ